MLKNKEKLGNEDFLIIENCMRIFLEAPSSNFELDEKILNKMQEIYGFESLFCKKMTAYKFISTKSLMVDIKE